MKRFAALQDWPVLSSRASVAASTTASRSSVASTMNGSEPPSSRATFFRCRPATSATAAPARSEPVTDTPWIRGSATIVAACSALTYTLTYAPVGQPGIAIDRLDGRGRLRALRRVLQDDHVAEDQVRRREPGHLVVREVPGHDPEQHAQRAAPDHGGALAEDRQRLIGRDHVRLVRVVLGDIRREVDLADRGAERLAHLPDDDGGQFLSAFPMELGRAADDPGPLGDRELPPGLEGRLRPCARASSTWASVKLS